jgi:hypothetical protein
MTIAELANSLNDAQLEALYNALRTRQSASELLECIAHLIDQRGE